MFLDGIRVLVGILTAFALFGVTACYKGVKIKVPPAVLKGHEVVLECTYDLEGNKLYSLKWYHNSAEFYRYTLTGSNSVKPFKLKGFHVIPEKSNATHVYLKHATRMISGKYSCEVTDDQPSFFTDMKTAELEVVEPPLTDPYISNVKSWYKVGDYLKAICSSDKSDPAVNMTWYVNGRPVEGPHVKKYKKTIEGNYISSHSTIQFAITEQLFNEGKLKLRCSTNIHDVWHRSCEKSVEIKMPKQDDEEKEEEDYAPAYFPTSSTEFSHEKFWLYVARNNPEATEWTDVSHNSSTNSIHQNGAIIFITIIVCLR